MQSSLDYYLGKQDDICFKCKASYEVISKIIHSALKSFETSEESFIRAMQDDYWELGLISTFKGLAKFGAVKPFTRGAPYQIVLEHNKSM